MKKDFLRTVFTLVFLLTITTSSNAQTFPWAISGKGTNANLNEGYGVCTDPFNNIYVVGYYASANFAFGTYSLSGTPGNIFLAKFDASGNVLWAKKCNTTPSAYGVSVSSDQNGNPFITGGYNGTAVFGTYTLTNAGNSDIFLAKYDLNGNLQWVKSAGGSGNETSCSVHADINGNSFITGNFQSPTIAFGTTILTNSGSTDFFLTKYDPNGNVLWAKSAGSNYSDGGSSVSTDVSGNAFVSGIFTSSTIAIGSTTLTNSDGWRDQFLAKYDPNGNVLWATKPIAPFHDSAWSVSVDPSGNAYVTGSYNNTTIVFGSYTVSMAPGSFNNMFIVKYNNNGTPLWAKGATGGYNGGYSVSSYSNGAYVSGFMYAPPGHISFGTGTLTAPPGSTDPCFIVHYDPNGNVGCATILASGGDDNNSIAVDQSGNAYLAGDYVPTTFVIGSNTLTSVGGGEDVFATKFNCSLTSGIDNAKESNNSKLFPNPNNGSFKLQIDNEIANGEIILMNSLGQKVHEQKITKGENNIITNSLRSGLYHYVLLQNTQMISNGKLSIE